MPEPATVETPRSRLENAEIIPEPTHEELAFALGRLLAWILDGRTLVKIGQRAQIVAAKIRPDMIDGATLAEIAGRRGNGRSQAAKLGRSFTRTFGIRGLNDRTTPATSASLRAAWRRAHPHARRRSKGDHYLKVINKFCEWKAAAEISGVLPRTDYEKQRMKREFDPIARFLAALDEG